MAGILKVHKEDYEDLGVCIRTEQVPAHKVAEYFEDKEFYNYYAKRYFNGEKQNESR